MHKIKLNNTTLEFYDHPANLPILKYYEFQFYLSICLSTDFGELTGHIASIENSIQSDNKEETLKKLHNLKVSFAGAASKVSFKWLAIGQLLCKLNDKDVSYFNDEEGLNELMAELSADGLTQQIVGESFIDLKKKLIPNLSFEDL